MSTAARQHDYSRGRAVYRQPGGRTEKDVAAEVIVRLLETGVLQAKPAALSRACAAVGVPVAVVRKVWVTNRGVKVPLDDTPVTAEPASLRVVRSPHNSYNRGLKAKKKPVEGKRTCSRCGELKDRSDFAVKVKATGQLKSACKPCNKKYQQERYLSSENLKRLGPVLRFILDDNDEHAGMMCPDCSEPCRPGDEVLASDAVLRHASHG